MTLTNILATSKNQPILTYFLHLKEKVINVQHIVSVNFNASEDYRSINIKTTDNVSHLISDNESIEEIKKFFGVE